jgi:integrase/recombinase XerC/integrase/recombinase XerD
MSKSTNSKVHADEWLKPDQVESLRSACYLVGVDYPQQRNESIIALLADTGLRVGELVTLDADYLRDGNSAL